MSTQATDTGATSLSLGGSEYVDPSTTTMPVTTDVATRRISKKRVAIGAGGVVLALLLLSLLLGAGYSAYKKRVSMPTPVAPVAPPVVTPAGPISFQNAERIDVLLLEVDNKLAGLTSKKQKSLREKYLVSKNGLLSLKTMGDGNKDLFESWFELAQIQYFRTDLFEKSGKFGKKTTPEQHVALVEMRGKANAALMKIAELLPTLAKTEVDMIRAQADAESINRYVTFSEYNFAKLDKQTRKKSKKVKSLQPTPDVDSKAKKNKQLEKSLKADVGQSQFIDVSLMRLAKEIAAWPLK